MRISDWSSDVCSSDLQRRSIGKCNSKSIEGIHQADRISEIGELSIVEFGSGSRVVGIGNAGFGDACYSFRPGMSVEQNGRASGRASVCQYGYISVDAVDLKQKTLTKEKITNTT